MNDLEQPSDGGAGNGNGPNKLPARNMADIARLFLDGARPATPPRRTPPKSNNQQQPLRQSKPADSEKQTMAVLGLAADTGASWKLLTLAAQGLAMEQATSVAIVGLIDGGAESTFIVDVVGVESTEELPVVRTATDAANPATADLQIARALHRLRPAVGLWIIAAPAAQSKTFPAIASIARHWLLACPTDNDGLVAAYQLLKHAFTRAEEADARRIDTSVFLLADDYAHAAVVHKRLRKAAQEFLKTELALAGAGPIRAQGGERTPLQPPIRVMSISTATPQDALWAALLDELCPMTEPEETRVPAEIETALEHVEVRAAGLAEAAGRSAAMAFDHLAQVLDPEERDALTAGLYDVPSPVATPVEPRPARVAVVETRPQPARIPVQVVPEIAAKIETRKGRVERTAASGADVVTRHVPPQPVVRQAPVQPVAVPAAVSAPASMQGAGQSLRALDLESQAPDRESQWQAVERSIWDLSPRSALLDAKPPMSWATETCISIDAGGRLNVWTLFKDASGGASWFALREWAREHKNLLALTRRDLTIDAEADVAVHIVLPLNAGDESVSEATAGDPVPVLLRTSARNVHLYRMRTVNWNGKQGLMVVPIS